MQAAGIAIGSIVRKVNGIDVSTRDQVERAIAESCDTVLLEISDTVWQSLSCGEKINNSISIDRGSSGELEPEPESSQQPTVAARMSVVEAVHHVSTN